MVQLWYAVYERCLMLGGKNDFPRKTIDELGVHIGDDVPYMDNEGDHATVIPQIGDDAHAAWTGGYNGGHTATGVDGHGDEHPYPGTIDPPIWFNETPDLDYMTPRWVPGVWGCYRALQQWLLENATGFIEWRPKADGSLRGGNGYDDWTDADADTGDPNSNPPPYYTLEKWAAKASIGHDEAGNYFTRTYPLEFRLKDALTYTQTDCDGEETTVTLPADTTYTDGTPIGPNQYARWIGNNVEDSDAITGTWCDDGGVSVWTPWPDSWVKADGKVYKRNAANTAWIALEDLTPPENPYGKAPDTVTKYGLIQRGDYLTPTLANEIFRGIDVLRWTSKGFDWRNYLTDPEAPENNYHDAGPLYGIYDPDNFTVADEKDTIDNAPGAPTDMRAWYREGKPYPNQVPPASVAQLAYTGDGLLSGGLEACYEYGHIPDVPHGIDGGIVLSCDVDFMTWCNVGGAYGKAGTFYEYGTATPPDRPDSSDLVKAHNFVWDPNGQTVEYQKWLTYDTVSGTEHERWSAKLGTVEHPTWCPDPEIHDTLPYYSGGDSWQGYLIINQVCLLRWDAGNMLYAMPMSFWGT
jgi:hypothetical protein